MGQLQIAATPVAPIERSKLVRIFKEMVILLAIRVARFTAVTSPPQPAMVPKNLLLLQQCVLQLLLENLAISSPASHLTSYCNVHASQVSYYRLAVFAVLSVGCFICSRMCIALS